MKEEKRRMSKLVLDEANISEETKEGNISLTQDDKAKRNKPRKIPSRSQSFVPESSF